ncbi:MAG TPA: hypothetical protein VFO12_02655 [Sphingomicrobium sp.]|nr:hypothetical protein [Sphingomicrobium sp.]
MMVSPLLLLAASVSSPTAVQPAVARVAEARPLRATAHATATIRIISGARFGPSYVAPVAGADRRSARVTDADGTIRAAELLEFQ